MHFVKESLTFFFIFFLSLFFVYNVINCVHIFMIFVSFQIKIKNTFNYLFHVIIAL